MIKEFKFEDFTLVLSRNCNLKCVYCPLEHFAANMSKDIISIFFDKIFLYKNYKINITLFGGEPLLNKIGIIYILEILEKNQKQMINNNLKINLKLITNGSLINDYFIEIFNKLNNLDNLNFLIDISIDGTRETQLKQRNYKKQNLDYFDNFVLNLKKLIKNKIKIELFMVIDFLNKNIEKDLFFLINEFRIPVFLMPVDLTYNYIKSNKNVKNEISDFMKKLSNIIFFIEKYNLKSFVANYKPKKKRNLKIPPIGPCFDYNGDCYYTRDFLFQMDKDTKFDSVGNIDTLNFKNIVKEFEKNLIQIQDFSLKTYYGKSYFINKKVGDYFTDLIFGK